MEKKVGKSTECFFYYNIELYRNDCVKMRKKRAVLLQIKQQQYSLIP